MTLLSWIVVFCLLGGVLSVLTAALFLLLPESIRARAMPRMVSFAIGALLGAAFLGVLPHALEAAREANVHAVPATVLGGLLGFFLLEKLVLWRHCHTDQCEAHGSASALPVDVPMRRAPEPAEVHGRAHAADVRRPDDDRRGRATGYLVVVGDAVHNFVDGVLIAAAFYTDVHLGVVTALAVAAHEIPQEVGDFAILLHSGFSRGQALFYNILSTLTTVVGGMLAYLSLEFARAAVPYVLAVAASSFIYIAVADLIPGLHRRPEPRATFEQLVLICAGIFVIYSVDAILH